MSRSRTPRPRKPKGASRVGDRFEAEVGAVAHGGHCIVRLPEPESRVVFVRHVLPGERVVLEITEGTEGDSFWRADGIEVLEASPDRVAPPCPYAGPGLCGGCDFQQVDLRRQRLLKTDVVREQFVRLARFDPQHPLLKDLVVEAVPGDEDGLRWRTRMQYVALPDGAQGMRVHRSSVVVEVEDCRIEHPQARELLTGQAEPLAPVEETVETSAGTATFQVEADGFWQVHPGAPRVLVETVLDFLQPKTGERALDLYSGVGLFARFLSEAVGEETRVVAIEGDRQASKNAVRNLAGRTKVVAATGTVDQVLTTSYDEPFDLVVLDPPREGARRKVVEQVVARAPRAVAYVACDPAALARDTATFAEIGYELKRLRALDLFPMTHHVECVALFER